MQTLAPPAVPPKEVESPVQEPATSSAEDPMDTPSKPVQEPSTKDSQENPSSVIMPKYDQGAPEKAASAVQEPVKEIHVPAASSKKEPVVELKPNPVPPELKADVVVEVFPSFGLWCNGINPWNQSNPICYIPTLYFMHQTSVLLSLLLIINVCVFGWIKSICASYILTFID